MPTIDPRKNSMPTDWRWAYDEFLKLKDLAKSVREPVSSWQLEFPSRTQRILGSQWTMTYSWEGQIYSKAFLGNNGKQAAQAIAKIIPIYADLVRRKKAGQAKQHVPKPVKDNPMWDHDRNRVWRDRYQQALKSVKGIRSQSLFEMYNLHLLKYVNRQAGILPMTIHEYWFSHPHSNLFPAPPRDKEELDKRQRILEARVKQREEAIRSQQEAGTYDPRYIPPL